MSIDTSVMAVIDTLYEFLDRSPVAIVLLDGQKRVIFANGQAVELHARGDGIIICSTGIGLVRPSDNTRLQALIARAVGGSEPPAAGRRSLGEGGGSMRALRPSGRRPYGFLVTPLLSRERDRAADLLAIHHEPATTNHEPRTTNHQPPTMNHEPRTTNHQPRTTNHEPRTTNHQPRTTNHQPGIRPAVCIVIGDPDRARTLPLERIQDAFDLTEAEGRLAACLAAGEGLRSAAHSLGITYGTARARLAEIFQKTDTRRQGELINLLLTTLAAV